MAARDWWTDCSESCAATRPAPMGSRNRIEHSDQIKWRVGNSAPLFFMQSFLLSLTGPDTPARATLARPAKSALAPGHRSVWLPAQIQSDNDSLFLLTLRPCDGWRAPSYATFLRLFERRDPVRRLPTRHATVWGRCGESGVHDIPRRRGARPDWLAIAGSHRCRN